MSPVVMWALVLLVALNLLLTYGVIRRLNDHESKILDLSRGEEPSTTFGNPAPGFVAPEFTTQTTAGSTIDRSELEEGVRFVGFFSTYCSPCRDELPRFVEFAAGRAEGQVMIVVEGPHDDAADMVGNGSDVSQVVLEPTEGQLKNAFGIDRYPAMLVLQDGVVVKNAATIGQLLVAASATV